MEFRYLHDNTEYLIRLDLQPDGGYTAHIGDVTYHVKIQKGRVGQIDLTIDGRPWRAYAASNSTSQGGSQLTTVALLGHKPQIFELEKITSAARRARSSIRKGNLSAQMPGQVLDILVTEGEVVKAGQSLMILEAMKMETRVTAPHDGVVTRILARKGDTVDRGQQLAELRASDE